MGSLFKTPKVSTQASGFYSQPGGFQSLYNSVLGNANSVTPTINANMFDPSKGITGDAFSSIMKGFAPTADSISADVSMLMNPFDDSVINQINTQAKGQSSLVNQNAAQAGQMNSNRSFLANSDVEQRRLDSIGALKQGQYNTALGQIFNNLVPQRQSDAANALAVGQQSEQAPLQALMSQLGILGQVPTNFGNGGSAAKTSGGDWDWAKIAGTAGQIGMMLSDRRLKTDIEDHGEENGFKTYKFRYSNFPGTQYIGVMADEVKEKMPEAVVDCGGYMAVNYDMIGVTMREVA